MAEKRQPKTGIQAFYFMLITGAISLIGSNMGGFAIGIWIFTQTNNATPLALISTMNILGTILFSNIGGMITDRYDRRLVILVSDSFQAVISVILIALVASDTFEVWHIYPLVLFAAMAGSVQFSAFTAAITQLVPDDHRDRANLIRQMTQPMAGIIGPAAGAILLAVIDISGVLIIDLLTYGVSIIALTMVFIPPPERSEESGEDGEGMLSELLGGLRFLRRNPPLMAFSLMAMFVSLPINMIFVLNTPYLMLRTGSEVTTGMLVSVGSAGMLVGGMLYGLRKKTEKRVRMVSIMIVLLALGTMTYGMARSPLMLGFTLFLTMAPLMIPDALLFSLMQQKVPGDLQGRVFAVFIQMAMFLRPAGFLMAGILADNVFEPMVGTDAWGPFATLFGSGDGAGIGLFLFIMGAVTVVMMAATYAIPNVRELEDRMPDYNQHPKEDAAPEADVLPESSPAPATGPATPTTA